MSFKILGGTPIATTLQATDITTTSTTLHGTVNPNYLSTTVSFEYGIATNYGSLKLASPSPLDGGLNMYVGAIINGLSNLTEYHYRIMADNALGTSYGQDMTFKVECMICSQITYVDGILSSKSTDAEYCGAALIAIKSKSPVIIGNTTYKWECK